MKATPVVLPEVLANVGAAAEGTSRLMAIPDGGELMPELLQPSEADSAARSGEAEEEVRIDPDMRPAEPSLTTVIRDLVNKGGEAKKEVAAPPDERMGFEPA